MALQQVLDDLGLKKNKGSVYLASLSVGHGNVVDIAKKARLPRTTTHEILDGLSAQGLVTYINQGRRRIYTAEPPEKLKSILREKERQVTDILPELRSLANTKGLRPRVRVYEGTDGVKTVFEDTLTVQDKLLIGILSMEDLYKVPGKKYMDDYVKRRVGAGIKLRVIRSEQKEVEETWPTSTAENRELKYAPEGMIFPMTMYLYDHKVVIMGTEKERFGMIIESQDFYQTQKNMFDLMWDVGRSGKRISG